MFQFAGIDSKISRKSRLVSRLQGSRAHRLGIDIGLPGTNQ